MEASQQEVEASVREKDDTIEGLRKEVELLTASALEKVVKLEDELSKKQEELKGMEQMKEDLQTKLATLESENMQGKSAQTAALEERRMEVEELKGRLESMDQEYQAFRQDTRTRMMNAVEKIKKSNEELRGKVAEIEKLQEEHASLTSKYETLSQTHGHQTDELTMLKEACDRQKVETEEQKQQLSTLRNELETKEALLVSSADHIQHLERMTKELEDSLQQLLTQQSHSRINHPLKWNEFEVILRCSDQDDVNWCLIRYVVKYSLDNVVRMYI